MYKFICANGVRIVPVTCRCFFGFAHGPEVRATGPLLRRTNSVAPVVAVRKTAAWKANHCGLDLAHVFDETFSKAIDICYRGFLADPNTVVQHAAEIFDKVAVNIGRNGSRGSSKRTSMRESAARGRQCSSRLLTPVRARLLPSPLGTRNHADLSSRSPLWLRSSVLSGFSFKKFCDCDHWARQRSVTASHSPRRHLTLRVAIRRSR